LVGPILFAFLIFLFPLALYCLALAYVNRSRRPVLVPGAWDCVSLLFGLSGFLLWTIPTLLAVLSGRLVEFLPGSDDPDTEWLWLRLIEWGYYAAVALGAVLLLVARRHTTAVYNVDTDRFGERLAAALAEVGLDCAVESGRLIIAPVEAFTNGADAIRAEPMPRVLVPPKQLSAPAPAGGPRYAELRVETFAAFCHVTLHWERYSPPIRHDIEVQLSRTLEHAVAPDNPAAGWFLGFSGLIFGSVTMFAILFVVLVYLHRR
jgi:hypothetical protein